MEILRSKYPEAHPPSVSSLEAYRGKPPAMMPVGITNATVSNVARQLLGAAGPGGVVLVSLKHWLLWFGAASMGTRQIFREFGDWMASGRPS